MLTNVVCTANLQCQIDLRALTFKTVNMIYDPARYSGAQWKQYKKIGGHCMVFSTGKVITNGKVNNINKAKKRLRRYARLIQRLWYYL